MEHPFLPSSQLRDKSLEELQSSINDLTSKLTFAYRTRNSALIGQVQMVMESYKNEYNRKMDELIKKQNIQNRINIKKEAEVDNKN
jgi:ribosomal protein L29